MHCISEPTKKSCEADFKVIYLKSPYMLTLKTSKMANENHILNLLNLWESTEDPKGLFRHCCFTEPNIIMKAYTVKKMCHVFGFIYTGSSVNPGSRFIINKGEPSFHPKPQLVQLQGAKKSGSAKPCKVPHCSDWGGCWKKYGAQKGKQENKQMV